MSLNGKPRSVGQNREALGGEGEEQSLKQKVARIVWELESRI
jgi:hypothetical protein